MKQSNNNKKSRDVTAFLYERLSRDDNMDGESYSIGNQKKLLIKVAKEKGYTNLVHFFDDGISGVTMDRPGFADMIQQLEQGKAAAVFVKDLSRLGRNYIEVGRLTEEFFPIHDIRLPSAIFSTNGMRATSARSGASATRSRAMPVNPWGSLLTGTSKTLRTPTAGSWTRKRRGSCGGFTA